LKMLLPHGVPTLEAMATKNFTRPDNVFLSDSLMDRCAKCTTAPGQRPPKTDHIPIIWDIELSLKRKEYRPRLAWALVDWEEYREKLEKRLEPHPYPEEIENIEEFQEVLTTLQKAIQETTDECVQRHKIVPYTKRWWNKDLNEKRKLARQLGKKSYHCRLNGRDPIHEEYRRARNDYTNSIKRAKKECWTRWLETVNDLTMWQTSSFISSPSTD
ncbi:hypothetical protein PUNSTDRAFT_26547, partial [Punctularia strigosozonata HHB-11173 SS5]|uniref:uncharacterized protein n=1 Tax=Punctularia strigosozonata (strain HHB-11173) TaxID=741275 RepID=UPI0004418322